MENGFKLRISRMFRSSFGSSCRSTKHITDVIEKKPIFSSENRREEHHKLIDLFSPKPRPFPSVCRPRNTTTLQTEFQASILHKNLKKSLLSSAQNFSDGRKCPPASPMSSFYLFQDSATTSFTKPKEKNNKKKKKRATNTRVRSRSKSFGLHEFPALSYNGLFSSDEDDEDDDKTTLFSSRSLSSDSSESFIRKKACKANKKAAAKGTRRSSAGTRNKAAETNPPMPAELKGKVKDSFAVVKRSSDPYNDFRTSMLEMIVEKQIFSGKDLENLLQCFLCLNSYHHHRVITEVFTEIWDALFSN